MKDRLEYQLALWLISSFDILSFCLLSASGAVMYCRQWDLARKKLDNN